MFSFCVRVSTGDSHQYGATYDRRALGDDPYGDGDPPSDASCSASMSSYLCTSIDPLSCPTAVRRTSLTALTCLRRRRTPCCRLGCRGLGSMTVSLDYRLGGPHPRWTLDAALLPRGRPWRHMRALLLDPSLDLALVSL